ncbi:MULTISPECIES: putative beta-lysine N-acetyltransferase [Bacillus]|uniref:N-acetyltransferase domain-containing protein n=2 Tax=Bacillus TaxID=1386 RepID=A0A0M4G864_9BACI|nr:MULTISPECIES: putative beta-lysine N-acetyltransferase [Bacillus]ALC81328.1 hypothetical protein AM592_06760 [Bacillus gobiensis]MBP1080342.1 putative beta-lysine N-acetyltransferase [Bacillus capparidis]MED1094204.1 putative beta-lysine N-acetyltransferase [Bacillus capparidis]
MIKVQEEHCHAVVDYDLINKRIRVLDYEGKAAALADILIKTGKERGMEKIIIFAKTYDQKDLLQKLFLQEGEIDGYYNGYRALLMTYYLDQTRKTTNSWERQDHLLQTILNQSKKPIRDHGFSFQIREAKAEDSEMLTDLYKKVFPIYPAPITDRAYIEKTITGGSVYYTCFSGDTLISAAAAEINTKLGHAEITDCATLTEFAGHSILTRLIIELEKKVKQMGIFHVFSLARAESIGMNKTLCRQSYSYGGRLINNCVIFNGLENMNIWQKKLFD